MKVLVLIPKKTQKTDRSHLEQSQERRMSRLKAPPPIPRRVRCVPAYDVVRGDTYLEKNRDHQDGNGRTGEGRQGGAGTGSYMG